jgi:hypothetical protein
MLWTFRMGTAHVHNPKERWHKVRWVSDMRELNKVIKPKDYTLPVIGDIMRKRQGSKYMTKLDLSMMFYAIELTDRAKDLCVISTVYGNYRYRRAPMGMRNSPAFAQSIIKDTLRDIDGLEVYIDDVGVWSNDWKSHVEVLSHPCWELLSIVST